eukprot:6280326-Pyramimonas_sp.AAC.1
MLLNESGPKMFMFPCSDQEGTGDVIEAVLGICKPGSAASAAFAAREVSFGEFFGKTWGLSKDGFMRLHGRFEDALRH